jgi:hypothetical protein
MANSIELIFIPSLTNCPREFSSLVAFYNDIRLKVIFEELLNRYNINSEIRDKSILIKPNWVMHSDKMDDESCLFTNHTFLIKFIECIVENRPKKIVIGDAPIQLCNWDLLIPDSFYKAIDVLSTSTAIPISILDLRRSSWDSKQNILNENKQPIDRYVIFDLKNRSFLEPISTTNGNFRVTNYDPARLRHSHNLNTHKYCISKELFEADIIFNIPKIKTHQKTGITNALKNVVGLNGDKGFLPHHRIGGTLTGGDCYPGNNPLRKLSEKVSDTANKLKGKKLYYGFAYLSALLWHMNKNSSYHTRSGGWYGNDTTWRMVLDLNYIASFGLIDGSFSTRQTRKIYSLSDGILGGQGDGPLRPEPLPLGIILFSDSCLLSDYIASILMRFDPNKIPIIKNHFDKKILNDFQIFCNFQKVGLDDINEMAINAKSSPGWAGHIEK